MLVAISQRNDKNKFGDFSDNLESNYINYLERFGIKLVVIPNIPKDVDYYFEKLPIEGIVLSGGNSINPELYGGKITDEKDISKERDATEKKLLEIAVKNKLPVLGICRGMQFINVFFGGKLKKVENHVKVNHKVNFIDTSFGNSAETNSYHGFGLTKELLSKELSLIAESEDGIVEALYHPSLPIAGIEWHPERESPDEEVNKKIIKAFLNREVFWK